MSAHSMGHMRFSYRIHGSGYERDIQTYGSGQPCRRVGVVGGQITVLRDEQDVVEGDAFLNVEVLHLRMMPNWGPAVKESAAAKPA